MTTVAGTASDALGRTGSTAARLQLLDTFDLRIGEEPIVVRVPAQRVLAYLALSDRPLLRVTLAARLWPESTEPHALGSLRSALWQLRDAESDVVDTSRARLELVEDVAVDVRELTSWARRQLDGVDPQDSDLEQVRRAGELLPDWYDDWVILERERLREVRSRALEALCDCLTSKGRYHPAMEAALAAISDDPLRESAHRCLIRIHLAEGNTAEALQCRARFRRMLNDALRLEPSEQMDALFDQLTTAR